MEKYQQSILITGGAGFIGSNFIRHYLKAREDINIINLDKLTYAGSLENLTGIDGYPNYKFLKGDICDKGLVESIFEQYNVKSVINFAAESHVDTSIERPGEFIKTNIEGTFTLLEASKKYWLKSPKIKKEGFEKARFHQISTDEVYGSLGADGYFNENSAYAPNSPYSASKAASDLLVRSYHHTYGLNAVISNCSNNYGPNQHYEKLIPTIIKKAWAEEQIPIYGDGRNIRDWLYVKDHCKALELIFEKGRAGETYLIGGDCEWENNALAEKICEIMDDKIPRTAGSYKNLITFVKDRPGHDFRYAIDASKISEELGWRPNTDFDEGLRKTIEFYLDTNY